MVWVGFKRIGLLELSGRFDGGQSSGSPLSFTCSWRALPARTLGLYFRGQRLESWASRFNALAAHSLGKGRQTPRRASEGGVLSRIRGKLNLATCEEKSPEGRVPVFAKEAPGGPSLWNHAGDYQAPSQTQISSLSPRDRVTRRRFPSGRRSERESSCLSRLPRRQFSTRQPDSVHAFLSLQLDYVQPSERNWVFFQQQNCTSDGLLSLLSKSFYRPQSPALNLYCERQALSLALLRWRPHRLVLWPSSLPWLLPLRERAC